MCGRMYLIFCLFCVINSSFADVEFQIDMAKNPIKCIETVDDPATATVIDGGNLQLSVNFIGRKDPLDVNYFQCTANGVENYVFVVQPERKHTGRNRVVSVNATSLMSGVWKCRILFNRGVGYVQPLEVRDGYNHTAAYCFVKVHVRLLETPQIILMNRMIVPTTIVNDITENIDHSVVYNYEDGDFINFLCIPRDEPNIDVKIELSYSFAENLNEMFRGLQASNLGYGFSTKLGEAHINSIVTCTYTGKNDSTKIQVEFVSNAETRHDGYLEMNGLIARPVGGVKNLFEVWEFNVSYLFYENESVYFSCKTNRPDFTVSEKRDGGGQCDMPKKYSYSDNLKFYIHDTNIAVTESMTIKSKKMRNQYKENKSITLDLSKSNILIELNKYSDTRESWIYYEFEEGEELQLKCEISKNDSPYAPLTVSHILNSEETKERNVTLTSEYNNVLFECKLEEAEKKSTPNEQKMIYKHIRVLFSKKVLTTIPPSTTTVDELHVLFIAVGAVVVCIILCCVVVVIWRMRMRSQKTDSGDNNYENLQHQCSTTSIPTYPKQWSRDDEQPYHVPVDIRNDIDIYAEPVRGPEDPYATPLPRSQRPPKDNQNSGPIYAELDIAQGGNNQFSNPIEPQYSSVKELYTQITPKKLRKNNENNYGNVFPDSPYVNSGNTEYVEPTYCQAYRK